VDNLWMTRRGKGEQGIKKAREKKEFQRVK